MADNLDYLDLDLKWKSKQQAHIIDIHLGVLKKQSIEKKMALVSKWNSVLSYYLRK